MESELLSSLMELTRLRKRVAVLVPYQALPFQARAVPRRVHGETLDLFLEPPEIILLKPGTKAWFIAPGILPTRCTVLRQSIQNGEISIGEWENDRSHFGNRMDIRVTPGEELSVRLSAGAVEAHGLAADLSERGMGLLISADSFHPPLQLGQTVDLSFAIDNRPVEVSAVIRAIGFSGEWTRLSLVYSQTNNQHSLILGLVAARRVELEDLVTAEYEQIIASQP